MHHCTSLSKRCLALTTILVFASKLSRSHGFVPCSMIMKTKPSLSMMRSHRNAVTNGLQENNQLNRREIMSNIVKKSFVSIGSYEYIAKKSMAFAEDSLEASNNSAYKSTYSSYTDGPLGLKYLITSEASDPESKKPERAQKVKTSYTLYLNGFPDDTNTDGPPSQQIDSTKGIFGEKPFEFYVGTSAVIKAWDLALLDMKEGEARRLIVPPSLGYGDKGAGGTIPGGATLFFEMKLTELGKMPKLNEAQLKWLDEHPL